MLTKDERRIFRTMDDKPANTLFNRFSKRFPLPSILFERTMDCGSSIVCGPCLWFGRIRGTLERKLLVNHNGESLWLQASEKLTQCYLTAGTSFPEACFA